MLEIPFIVVFTVSSSVQFISPSCKGYQTHIAIIADGAEYAALVHPPQPSIRSVPPTTTRYEPLPTTVDDRDIAEAPFFAGRLPYCRPKPSPPPRPVNYTPPVCVEQNYRSATTWRWKTPASSIHLLPE